MSRRLRGLVGRVADRLLPQTTAAAGCPKECWKDGKRSGGQGYLVTCCQWEDCSIRCG
ncbi:hypothetical protein ACF08A_08480 [Streptomyces cellulosae]